MIPYPMSQYYPLRKLLWGRGSLLGFSMVFRPAVAGTWARIKRVHFRNQVLRRELVPGYSGGVRQNAIAENP